MTGLATQTTGYIYQRGPAGNLTSATELSGRTVNWSYDGIYRLTNETISLAPSKNNGSVSYGLDPVGNRQSENSSLSGVPSGSWSYNADDKLSSETYDADGNVTAEGGKAFSYDSQNRLVAMNGGAVQMLYDSDGNWVAKSVSGVVTRYLVDDLNPTGYAQVVDELTSGAVTRTYTYGLQRISQNEVISNTWTPSFYSYDGGGNVRALTNTAGATTDSYEYDAFGNSFTVSGSTPNEMMYRDEQYDSDLGLYYLRARYYNPTTGRFMSRDPNAGTPLIPAMLHKYLYTGGDPVNHIDPRGRADLFDYAIRSNAVIPEAKLIDIYGCVAGASLAAVDLILGEITPNDTTGNAGTGLGVGSAALGCVVLVPGLNELAESGAKVTRAALKFVATASTVSGWGSCAANAEDFVNGLNSLLSGNPNESAVAKSLEDLGGCVGSALGAILKAEVE